MVIEVGKNNFQEEVMLSDRLVILDFYAQWCGPCKALAPILEEISKKYDGKIKIVKVNVDEEESLAVKFRIASIPTVVFIKGGEVVTSFVGLRRATDIEKIIEKQL